MDARRALRQGEGSRYPRPLLHVEGRTREGPPQGLTARRSKGNPRMTKFGLMLSSEEHTPRDLVDLAVRAEDAGFDYIAISDHFHPWTSQQGHSPFVWSVLGGIASATDTIGVGTAVTCPTIRMHPAIIAQAAATAAAMMPGRFFLGLG